MNLEGKSALVTGGAKGIGFYTVLRLLEAGCKVSIWDYDHQALEEVKIELNDFQDSIRYYHIDVADKEQVYAKSLELKEDHFMPQILINNAGYVKGAELLQGFDEEWEKTINVNLNSVIYMMKAFLPAMYENNEGYIINISSASSTLGVPKLAVYAATKWAVWGVTESMRLEAYNNGKDGVHFSTVHPSYIARGMFEGARLGFLGNLLAPLISHHDKVAKAIVNEVIAKKKNRIMIPKTVNLNLLLRGLLPDKLFQKMMILIGADKSMDQWYGRKEG
jgi:all-trans-retinol dehydrogenase (NAD+)